MTLKNIKKLVPAIMMAGTLLFSVTGFSQTKKLPDGTVVYENGNKKLPNGTIIKKDGTILKTGGQRWPDGTLKVPGEDRNYSKTRKKDKHKRKGHLPPGQAKKRFGGEAKDYAPGHEKEWKKNKKRDDKDNDQEHNGNHKGKHKGNGKHDD